MAKPSSFTIDVLTLVTGVTIAQIIPIIASPLLTRLYSPESFGLLALFTSISGIIGVIACMRYELAIMLPKKDEEAANVLGLSLLFVVLVSITSIPLLIFLQQPLLQFIKAPQLSPFIWLIPPIICVNGFFLAFNYWNTRTKNFYRLSIARVTSSCTSTGTQLGAGLFGLTSGGTLIGASILGQIVSTLVISVLILREYLLFFKTNITGKGMCNALKRYSNFPKYDIWSALLNTISWQIPIFLLSYFFSTTIVGYYSLGMMMIQLPMSFIGSSISQVFYQRAAEAKHEDELRLLIEKVFILLLKVGLFPMIVLLLTGKDIFMVVFGSQWGIAGLYVQILSIWAFVWFISSPLSTIISVFEKQSWGLSLNIIIFLTRVISLVIGGILGDALISLFLFSFSGVITYGYFCVKIMIYSKISMNNILNLISTNVILIIPAGIVFVLMKIWSVNSIIILVIGFLMGFFYYAIIIKNEPLLNNKIARYFMKQ